MPEPKLLKVSNENRGCLEFLGDLVRISKAKERADHSPNTIRKFAEMGLKLYRVGKNTYFSIAELEAFIRLQSSIANKGGAQ